MEQTQQFTRHNLAKVDKSQYSKAEWKLIREQRRKDKNKEQYIPAPNPAPVIQQQNSKRYVLCLKHGDKYSSDYVNILKRMVAKYLNLEYEFVCLTDNALGLDQDIKIINLPPGLSGWWCKPYMFSKDLPINGTVLYMDLDVVISGNLDKLFEWEKNDWCIIRDFTKVMRPKWDRYNSSVIRFETGKLDHIWRGFIKNRDQIMRRHHGDQDWIYEADKNAKLWPDSWIQSWKWQIRKDRTFKPGGIKGSRELKRIENVTPSAECSICVFHGDPNPHNCKDPWVVDNWR